MLIRDSCSSTSLANMLRLSVMANKLFFFLQDPVKSDISSKLFGWSLRWHGYFGHFQLKLQSFNLIRVHFGNCIPSLMR